MEGGSSNGERGGGEKKKAEVFFISISHLFLLSYPVLVVVPCAPHWLFFYLHLQKHAYCDIYMHITKCGIQNVSFFI